MKAINITAYTDDATQIEAIKAVFKAFKIKYKISKTQDSEKPYKPEFVKMVQESEVDLENGKGIQINLDELEKLCK